MANPQIAISLTLQEEGGFNRDLGDGAGMTYRGITEKYAPEWDGWKWLRNYIALHGYPKKGIIFPELENSVYSWYIDNEWYQVRGNQIENQELANFCFDFVVNSGQARKQINIAINNAIGSDVLLTNNLITNDTLNYLNTYTEYVYPYIVDQRKQYLSGLDSFEKFGEGWFNRIANFPAVIAEAIGGSDEKKK